MTGPTNFTAADRDKARYAAATTFNNADLIAHAARKSGRSAAQIGIDFARMHKSPMKITLPEYVRWRLYDPDRFTADERAAFISSDLHWPIAHQCCQHDWHGASEDKILADTILAAAGLPVPRSIAVIDNSPRAYPGIEKITGPDRLREVLLAQDGSTVFGKVVNGMVGFGVFRIIGADQTHITCAGHDPVSYDQFLTETVGNNSYVLQVDVPNHGDIAPYCSGLAAIRMANLVDARGVSVPRVVMKMPASDNIACAFWRPGNIVCDIEPGSGEIKTVVMRDGLDLDFLPDHPTVPGLMGRKLPFWEELCEINERAAAVFAPLRYQSTDMALTPEGPVVIEINYGGSFDVLQNGSGTGFATPEVRAFFESCGYVFGGERPAKKSGFGFFKRG